MGSPKGAQQGAQGLRAAANPARAAHPPGRGAGECWGQSLGTPCLTASLPWLLSTLPTPRGLGRLSQV